MDFMTLFGLFVMIIGIVTSIVIFNSHLLTRNKRFKLAMMYVLMSALALATLLTKQNLVLNLTCCAVMVALAVVSFRAFRQYAKIRAFAHKESNVITAITEALIELDASHRGMVKISKGRKHDLKAFVHSAGRAEQKIAKTSYKKIEKSYTEEQLRKNVLSTQRALSSFIVKYNQY